MRDPPHKRMPVYLKITGTIVRSLFLIVLIGTTALISLPVSITEKTLARFSPADFVRVGLGVVVCLFVAIEIFRRPKDDEGYRVWAFIGLIAAALLMVVMASRVAFPALI